MQQMLLLLRDVNLRSLCSSFTIFSSSFCLWECHPDYAATTRWYDLLERLLESVPIVMILTIVVGILGVQFRLLPSIIIKDLAISSLWLLRVDAYGWFVMVEEQGKAFDVIPTNTIAFGSYQKAAPTWQAQLFGSKRIKRLIDGLTNSSKE